MRVGRPSGEASKGKGVDVDNVMESGAHNIQQKLIGKAEAVSSSPLSILPMVGRPASPSQCRLFYIPR